MSPRRSGPLKVFLSDVTGVEANVLISFLSDGTQLRQENLRELSGVEDQSIFVFNREHLEVPLEQMLQDLIVEPQLQPEIDVTTAHTSPSSTISAYARAANFHYQHILHRAHSQQAQCLALRVASLNLDSHVLSLTSAYEVFAASAQRELEKQEEVLRGHPLDMEVISRVKVHTEFLSPTVRRAVEMGGKARHLGDYVSAHKMQMVAESCVRLHEDLVNRYHETKTAMTELSTGADEVRVASTNPFNNEVEVCIRRAKDYFERITQAPYDAPVKDIQELDAHLRDEVRTMARLKNNSTSHCLRQLRNVSRLQSTLADLPPALTSLESDLRLKAGFPHLQRLHNMIYYYGATIVEIVRRKEFGKLFMERAQTIAEMMAKLTANEKKRRQVYRSEVHGQLPFQAPGMDEPAPSMEISTKGSKELPFTLSRDDLLEFFNLVDEIAESTPTLEASDSHSQSAVIHPVKEVRAALDKLVAKIDTLEADFDKLAEKSNEVTRVQEMHRQSDARVAKLLEEQGDSLRQAELAQARGADLERQLRVAREEGERAARALRETSAENERLLKLQASEADRLLRDHIAEADGDRAVLEHQFTEVRADVDRKARQIEELKVEMEIMRADRVRLEDDLATLTAKQDSERLKRELEESRGAMVELRRRMVAQENVTREIIKVAAKMRDTNIRTMAQAQKYIIASAKSNGAINGINTQTEDVSASMIASTTTQIGGGGGVASTSGFPSSSFPPSTTLSRSPPSGAILSPTPQPFLAPGPSTNVPLHAPIDASSPEMALAALSAFDLDAFTDAMNKTGMTIRKWQKQCKEYRERAKGKITYRNFAKSDLALFLPTRNSVARPWAAFNVSFPHYFLKAEGHLAEQLKTREWVVARITSITERVVDHRDPQSNPYGLGDGVKYFMLEVEDWTQPTMQSVAPRSVSGIVRGDMGMSGVSVGKRQPPLRAASTSLLGGRSGKLRAYSGDGGWSGPTLSEGTRGGVDEEDAANAKEKTPVREEDDGIPTRRSTELGGSSLREPLPRPPEDLDDLATSLPFASHGRGERTSLQSLTKAGPFVPLLEPVERLDSPEKMRRAVTLPAGSMGPSAASLSKVVAEGRTSPRLDKGKQKELEPGVGMKPALSQATSALSASPVLANARTNSPSPSSSTQSRVRRTSGTPLGVPFSGRGGKRPLAIPGAFGSETAGSSPGTHSHLSAGLGNPAVGPTTTTTSATTSKAIATIAVTSDLPLEGHDLAEPRSRTSSTYGVPGERAADSEGLRARPVSSVFQGGVPSWASIAATFARRKNGAKPEGEGGTGVAAALLRRFD
ncbi:oligomeric, coiled-coil, peripheral membrane protein [Tulasnella sp. 403]|nr:oligomeric, coiled-coil, peripheral membrane protein [Tulasnella sp. 403]